MLRAFSAGVCIYLLRSNQVNDPLSQRCAPTIYWIRDYSKSEGGRESHAPPPRAISDSDAAPHKIKLPPLQQEQKVARGSVAVKYRSSMDKRQTFSSKL